MAWSLSSGGLVAPGTFASAADNNTLDDVEYGAFTPTINAGENITCEANQGTYYIVGRLVQLQSNWRRNEGAVSSGSAQWAAFPFTTNDSSGTIISGGAWGDSGSDEGHKGTWAVWANSTSIHWLLGADDHHITRYTYIYDTNDTANGMANRDHLNAGVTYIAKASH